MGIRLNYLLFHRRILSIEIIAFGVKPELTGIRPSYIMGINRPIDTSNDNLR